VRRYGIMMLLVGILGFYYATSRMQEVEPVPPGISISEYTRYPAGRWELLRYGLAAIGGIGAIFALFPEGR
jgi:hypothetical protein